MFNEENYPMTYEEYEKRVVELFLEPYTGTSLETMKDRINEELSNNPNYIHGFYGHDCFRYDHPEIFGESSKKQFEDESLRQIPVVQLKMLLD